MELLDRQTEEVIESEDITAGDFSQSSDSNNEENIKTSKIN